MLHSSLGVGSTPEKVGNVGGLLILLPSKKLSLLVPEKDLWYIFLSAA